MIRQQWGKIRARVDVMSLRERALIFAVVAFLLVLVVKAFLLDPLLLKQQKLSRQVVQQQEKMKEIQSQIDTLLQARSAQDSLPQHQQIALLKQELEDGRAYLKSNREKLVPPEKMADLLRQVLSRNANLQLQSLQTLPVTPLLETKEGAVPDSATVEVAVSEGQIFKHGVVMTVRGNYLDMLQYLTALERMPTQMFWGKVTMAVEQYPAAELTLTLYTLSLDKTWLQL